MTESEEEQTADAPADESAEPKPRTRERKLFLGGLRGGILGALISGLLAWGLVSGTTGQGTDWKAVLPTAAALLAMPFGFLVGAVIGAEAARRKLELSAALVPFACRHATMPPPGEIELVVDGREVLVEPSLARNLMLGGPPGGGPMMLYVGLAAADSLPLPAGLNAPHAWVVSGAEVWETDLERDSGWTTVYKAGFRAYDGPRWGPNVYVDVTVQVDREGGTTRFVRVPRCLIEMAI